FEEKLGMAFLQMHDNYKPKDYDRLAKFLHSFPKGYPLAVEVRNQEWFSDKEISERLYKLFEETHTTNVLVDTAGRRDMVHMRLTTPTAFIRYVGANHPSDYDRLVEWIKDIKEWKEAGLELLYFIIHLTIELKAPLSTAQFSKHPNQDIGSALRIPNKANTLFEDGVWVEGAVGVSNTE